MAGTHQKPELDDQANSFRFHVVKLKKPQSIRVLELEPSEDINSALHGNLRSIDLPTEPGADPKLEDQYEALSWAWGDENAKSSLNIVVNGKLSKHAIKPNLELCLRRLRYPKDRRVLWIDAICINQASTREKNRQVAIMREIYTRAKGAIVWLGEASAGNPPLEADLRATFDFIQGGLLKRGLDQITQDEDHFKHWENLQEIMMKPWFNRRWVIQECALAHQATVYIGEQIIPWKDFSYAVSLFVDAEPALHLSNKARFNRLYRANMFSQIARTGAAELTELQSSLFRSSIQGPQSLRSLEFLVSRLPMFECEAPQDAIYSLLAVAQDTAPHSGNFWDASPMDKYLQEYVTYQIQKSRAAGATGNDKSIMETALANLEKKAESGRRVVMLLGESVRQRSYPITYESAPIDVYVYFMKFVIKNSGSLDMICRPWAPRFKPKVEDQKPESDPESSSEDEEERKPHGANGIAQPESIKKEPTPVALPSWIQDRSKRAFCAAGTDDGRDLERIVRRNADSLVGLPGRSMYAASGSLRASLRQVSYRRRGETDHSIYVRGFVIGTVSGIEELAVGGSMPRAWLTFGGWNDYSKDPPSTLCRTLVANREPSRDHAESTPPSYYDMVCKRILIPAFQKNAVNIEHRLAQTEDVLEQRYLRRILAVISERVLFKMKAKDGLFKSNNRKGNGKTATPDLVLALGPKPTRSRHAETESEGKEDAAARRGVRNGDLICILYGCSVPVILRRCERKPEALEQEKDLWKREFALKFLRGIRRAQRIWLLNRLQKAENEKKKQAKKRDKTQRLSQQPDVEHDNTSVQFNIFSRAGSPLTDAPSQQQDGDLPVIRGTDDSPNDALPLGKEARKAIRAKVKGITQSISEQIQKRKKAVEEEETNALGIFEAYTKEVEKLHRTSHQDGTTYLGYPLIIHPGTPEVTKEQNNVNANPRKEPLRIPEMQTHDPDPREYFEMIGECYVDGMMDGEALDARSGKPKGKALQDDLFDQTFEIL